MRYERYANYCEKEKTELITLAVCFILANLCNVYAIVEFDTQWKELATSLGFVAVATIVLYAIWTPFRLIVYFIFFCFWQEEAFYPMKEQTKNQNLPISQNRTPSATAFKSSSSFL